MLIEFMASDDFANHPNNPSPGQIVDDGVGEQRVNHVSVNVLADEKEIRGVLLCIVSKCF